MITSLLPDGERALKFAAGAAKTDTPEDARMPNIKVERRAMFPVIEGMNDTPNSDLPLTFIR